jgi:hypothetical protein
MSAPARRRLSAGLLTWALFVVGTVARAESPVEVIPLAVRDGRCECVIPTPHANDKYYLVVGSVTRDLGPHRVAIQTSATPDAVSITREVIQVADSWQRRIRATADRLEKARGNQPAPHEYRRAVEPPKQKVFHVFVSDRDPLDTSGYVAVTADLSGTGEHCLVYVDRALPDPARLESTVKDVIATFDNDIYSQACKRLGHSLDVDRDGRFTILLTPWLDKLGGGKIKLDGFVHGSDFYRDLDAPFGNRCDMMYLNPSLKPGSYLHTLLAHEFTHAVVFSEHVFGEYLADESRRDEESWLNEGLAHLNEDAHHYCWDNLDYRISAFLAEPERYSVVVPDYFHTGLFRSHGHRGATYLFLLWCADHYGPDLMRKLVQSNLSGIANLETATGQRFEDLFREWSLALLLSNTALRAKEVRPFLTMDLRKPLGGRMLCGPRVRELPLAGTKSAVELAGTSAAFFELGAPENERSRVRIIAGVDAELQVTLIRVPSKLARLDLRYDQGHLVLTVHDADVKLDRVAWERVPPDTNKQEDTSFRVQDSAILFVRAWFGDPQVKAGETRRASVLDFSAGNSKEQKMIFKVSATDAGGHRLSAYVDVPAHR